MNSKIPKQLASRLALGFILSLAVSAPFASAEEHDRRHGDSSSAQQSDGGHRDNGQRGNGGGQRDSGQRNAGPRDSGQRNSTPQPVAAPQATASRDIQPRSDRPQFSNHNNAQPQGQPQYVQTGDRGRNDNRGGSNNAPQNNAPQYNGTQGHSGWQSGNDRRDDRNDNRGSGWQGDRGHNNDRGDRGGRGRFDYHSDRHFRDYDGVRFGFYFFPDRGYYRVPSQWYGHRWSTGEFLPSYFYTYRIYDWDYYGLPIPPVGCGYIFVGEDAVLIDLYSGRIIDVIYDVY